MLTFIGAVALIDCMIKMFSSLRQGTLDLGLTVSIIFIICALFYIN